MPETAGQPWSDREVEAVLGLYLRLLNADLTGTPLVKMHAYRDLIATEVPNRSITAVEYKLRNISAVMTDLGLPRVPGLAPARNIQGSLTEAVRSRLLAASSSETLDRLAAMAAERAATYASRGGDLIVDPPTRGRPGSTALNDVRHFDWNEAERRRLGRLGEEWVVRAERARLTTMGREDLAAGVRHVSVEDGDGAGFDVRSFSAEGAQRLVEVKTTASTIGRAFHVTRNELKVSQKRADNYWLYRVFDFYEQPRMYQVPGPLDRSFALTPSSYLARLGGGTSGAGAG